jgi:hypothetical protein
MRAYRILSDGFIYFGSEFSVTALISHFHPHTQSSIYYTRLYTITQHSAVKSPYRPKRRAYSFSIPVRVHNYTYTNFNEQANRRTDWIGWMDGWGPKEGGADGARANLLLISLRPYSLCPFSLLGGRVRGRVRISFSVSITGAQLGVQGRAFGLTG